MLYQDDIAKIRALAQEEIANAKPSMQLNVKTTELSGSIGKLTSKVMDAVQDRKELEDRIKRLESDVKKLTKPKK